MKCSCHTPVLFKEVLDFFDPKPGQNFVDGTLGHGGHAGGILERTSPDGRLLGIDRDGQAIEMAKERLAKFDKRVTYVRGSYDQIKDLVYDNRFPKIHGVLLDLGFSTGHISDPRRGFSFQTSGPLDMRYDQSSGLTAAEVVNSWPEDELSRIFRQLGEERHARKIAKAIYKARRKNKFTTTLELAECISSVVPRRGKIHPATKVFQALRIAVNDELEIIKKALPDCINVLEPGGKLVVISFHSLEDRIVKKYFKEQSDKNLKILTKKVIKPGREEILANSASRSAKLRVAERM